MADEAAKPAVKLKGNKPWEYTLGDLIAVGDIADIYFATNPSGSEYVIKISRVPEGHALMLREKELLNLVEEKSKALGIKTYERYTPIHVESFTIKDGFKKHVRVCVRDKQAMTFADICGKYMLKHGTNLPGVHVAWMLRRALEFLGFLHDSCGYIHGAITPEHLMFTPDRHGMQLVGFGQNVGVGGQLKLIVPKFRNYYAPEVLAKGIVDGGTDVYMLGKVLLDALRGASSVDDRKLATFLEGMSTETLRSRTSAWQLHDEFGAWCRRVYGLPAFHVLEL